MAANPRYQCPKAFDNREQGKQNRKKKKKRKWNSGTVLIPL